MTVSNGWIKLHRCLLDSTVWENHNLTRFWIWCLLKASHSAVKNRSRYNEVGLSPGQFIFGRITAASETGLSERTIRTCVKALKAEGNIYIAEHPTRQFSIITIVNWDRYQGEHEAGDQPATNVRPTYDQPATTYKNDQELITLSPRAHAYPEIPDSLYRAAQSALGWMTPDKPLQALLMDYPADWIEEAVKEGGLRRKTSAAYIRGICQGYRREGGPRKNVNDNFAGKNEPRQRTHGQAGDGSIPRGKYADIDARNFGHR